ncbi:MAG: 4Fe-4S binding protein [Elusimicrobiaceae bacterium]|jgi:formate hydrogenlyase subunit 6/NADH:ubiquinone oxidoreductase subunit I
MFSMAMLKTTIANLFRKPATVLYPFVPGKVYANTRGEVMNDTDSCIFCGICQRRCPANAITVNRAAKEWKIERLRCIVCGNCADVCPKKCLSFDNQYPKPLAGYEKGENVKTLHGKPDEPKPPAAPANPA